MARGMELTSAEYRGASSGGSAAVRSEAAVAREVARLTASEQEVQSSKLQLENMTGQRDALALELVKIGKSVDIAKVGGKKPMAQASPSSVVEEPLGGQGGSATVETPAAATTAAPNKPSLSKKKKKKSKNKQNNAQPEAQGAAVEAPVAPPAPAQTQSQPEAKNGTNGKSKAPTPTAAPVQAEKVDEKETKAEQGGEGKAEEGSTGSVARETTVHDLIPSQLLTTPPNEDMGKPLSKRARKRRNGGAAAGAGTATFPAEAAGPAGAEEVAEVVAEAPEEPKAKTEKGAEEPASRQIEEKGEVAVTSSTEVHAETIPGHEAASAAASTAAPVTASVSAAPVPTDYQESVEQLNMPRCSPRNECRHRQIC